MKRYLFYIVHNYAFEILRPLQTEIRRRGHEVAWFIEGKEINHSYFDVDEHVLHNIPQVLDFAPRAVFVPGNLVPSFIPGLKVQIFHGFEWKKKGHFRDRGCFDLYCTQGPFFTCRFKEMSLKLQHFNVVETGWPKTDTLFKAQPYEWAQKRKTTTVLYAPTFSPALTSAIDLYDEIARLAATNKQWQWLVKFHPKMSPNLVEQYRSLTSENLHIIDTAALAPVLQVADVILSDTSSIITEFALLNKPIVTYKNKAPEEHLLNFSCPSDLEATLNQAINADKALLKKITESAQNMHPYADGKSSSRVLDAAEDMISQPRNGLKKKPLNALRMFKLRKKLTYWRGWI
ncbi:MAG: CDP-glycerol glycerophosphotransferase (TagB/SpsB family) [Paraglaciecola sp.]|jgi:CDP-glycerol glycerophosphotransferase (TagB/SpsB family)